MALVSISEAIKLSGVSRGTFYRKYLNAGLISATQDHAGKKQIETSELLRVFGRLNGVQVHNSDSLDNTEIEQSVQDGTEDKSATRKKQSNYLAQLEQLHAEQLKSKDTQIALLREQIEGLKADKAFHQKQNSDLTETIKLLEGPKHPRLWWQFWK
ncbi:MAG: hypothetical protein ACPGVP_19440 [Thiolinea sp.]